MGKRLDPDIFKMKQCAEDLIAKGDDDGLLALYWIKKWIKDARTTYDEDEWEKGNKVEIPLEAHPSNFAWCFNNSQEIGEESNTRNYYAIWKVHRIAVEGKTTNNCGCPL